jgi:hypothetical protein
LTGSSRCSTVVRSPARRPRSPATPRAGGRTCSRTRQGVRSDGGPRTRWPAHAGTRRPPASRRGMTGSRSSPDRHNMQPCQASGSKSDGDRSSMR